MLNLVIYLEKLFFIDREVWKIRLVFIYYDHFGGKHSLFPMVQILFIDVYSCFLRVSFKGYLRFKTITSENVLSEAQVKNFLIS